MAELSYQDLRDSVVTASRELFTAGVMSHSGHANLSARVDDGSFLLTTTGMVRNLTSAKLARVTLAGETLEGELTPENAEIIAMHSVVYRSREDLGGIIHTH